MTIAAIIPAAGMGRRLGVGYNKQYIDLLGTPMVVRTIETISANEQVTEVIWVVGADEIEQASELVNTYNLVKVAKVVAGGSERIFSVINGVAAVSDSIGYLLIHDGARPLITQPIIDDCIAKAKSVGAAIVAVPVKDTIKTIDSESDLIIATPARETLWAAQTPQIIKKDLFANALKEIIENNTIELTEVTDDAMLMEITKRPVAISRGSYENIKVTTPEDVKLAELILKERR